MAIYISPATRQCAACANWGGNRKPDVACRLAEVKDGNEKGTCYLPQKRYGPPVFCQYSCPNFQKWSGLR